MPVLICAKNRTPQMEKDAFWDISQLLHHKQEKNMKNAGY